MSLYKCSNKTNTFMDIFHFFKGFNNICNIDVCSTVLTFFPKIIKKLKKSLSMTYLQGIIVTDALSFLILKLQFLIFY
jgi:hypothetical protein